MSINLIFIGVNRMIETIVAIVGGICGIISIGFNVLAIIRDNKSCLAEFIAFANDKEFIDAKIKVYKLNECSKEEYFEYCNGIQNEISYMCNFFQNAGILVENNRLPFTIFTKGGWGYITIKVYNLLEKYIEGERKAHNKYHSKYFEELRNRILRSNYYCEKYRDD